MTVATGVAVVALGTLAACGATGHGTGSITPVGTTHGTFRYCSYTPDSDGIEISRHESAPCVVNDTRSKNDRKKKATTTVVPGSPSSPTPTSPAGSLKKSTPKNTKKSTKKS